MNSEKAPTRLFPDGELGEAVERGAVDDRGLRLWLRAPGVNEVVARLEVSGRQAFERRVTLSTATDWTGTVELAVTEPAPGAAYTCRALGRTFTGRLAPSPGTQAGLTFAFGSCHQPFRLRPDGSIGVHAGAGIYPVMLAELQREQAELLLLIGDQIYADGLAPVNVRNVLAGPDGDAPRSAQALNAYRQVYRGYFAQRGFRKLREALPTYCMWDDHDIFNDWGSRLAESKGDRVLFQAAARAYGEYQHQRNPGGSLGMPPFWYSFVRGDVGFLVLDLRGARDYDEGRLLGGEQWRAVRAYLQGDGARRVQTLFVVASVPVAYASRWFVSLFSWLHESAASAVRDRWCSPHFVASRDELLDDLFAWQTGASARQVFLLGGDVHAGSAYTIRQRRGRGCIRQLTSSALTTPHGRLTEVESRIAILAPNLCEPRLRFRRHFLSFANNYGLVRVQPLPAGGHRVTFDLRAFDPATRALRPAGRLVSLPRS